MSTHSHVKLTCWVMKTMVQMPTVTVINAKNFSKSTCPYQECVLNAHKLVMTSSYAMYNSSIWRPDYIESWLKVLIAGFSGVWGKKGKCWRDIQLWTCFMPVYTPHDAQITFCGAFQTESFGPGDGIKSVGMLKKYGGHIGKGKKFADGKVLCHVLN